MTRTLGKSRDPVHPPRGGRCGTPPWVGRETPGRRGGARGFGAGEAPGRPRRRAFRTFVGARGYPRAECPTPEEHTQLTAATAEAMTDDPHGYSARHLSVLEGLEAV